MVTYKYSSCPDKSEADLEVIGGAGVRGGEVKNPTGPDPAYGAPAVIYSAKTSHFAEGGMLYLAFHL